MTIEIYRDSPSPFSQGEQRLPGAQWKSAEAAALSKYSASLPVDFHRVLTTCWPTATMAAGPYELYSLRENLPITIWMLCTPGDSF